MVIVAVALGYTLTLDTEQAIEVHHSFRSGDAEHRRWPVMITSPNGVRVANEIEADGRLVYEATQTGDWDADHKLTVALEHELYHESRRRMTEADANTHLAHAEYRQAKTLEECIRRRRAWTDAEIAAEILLDIRKPRDERKGAA